ncbi:DUF998 domain-containing protein [Antribacter gilvus]|uniref:DUF998 domain-containing protein n=1 Tax=Antribacter gilvus TaxID=2304675 RepID=UPI000F7824E3|nr:DUF998 domain-containing protein [Antribacter gilvus]
MPENETTPAGDFDTGAAVTRSLLGWGVVAGPFYLVVGLVFALTRPGFDLGRHALSHLMLGEHGWLQTANLALSGLMTLAAAYGFLRAIRSGRGLALGALTGVYGLCLVLSAIFPPDPVPGFPPGSAGDTFTTSGILHLLFGALGFAALGAAAITHGLWARRQGDRRRGTLSIVLGILTIVTFFAGAGTGAVGLIWIGVVIGWAWLALASAHVYTVVPHPVLSRR